MSWVAIALVVALIGVFGACCALCAGLVWALADWRFQADPDEED